MFNIPGFYPTSPRLINKMIEGIKWDQIKTMLEPEAGKADIVDRIVEKIKFHHCCHHEKKWREYLDIDCIEINENLRHIIKGKGYRVVYDNFLTFETFKRYDAIIMNPPFDEGERHLLKALDLMKRGGIIRCLLNAETIKNPFSNLRKDLIRRLDDLNADIEFIQDAFIDAERKTTVEVALIKIIIPEAKNHSVILEGLRQQENYRIVQETTGAIVNAKFEERIVAQYNFEIQVGLKLLEEYFAMRPYVMRTLKKKEDKTTIFEDPAISVIVGDQNSREKISDWQKPNEYIKLIRYKYWKALFQSDEFMQACTSNLREEFYERVKELQNYDFSLFNIYTIKAEIAKSMSKSIDDTILTLFDDFSRKHHWSDETSKNIHYFNGWKTNSSWKINKRIIVPNMGIGFYDYKTKDRLKDIEKVLNYLDCGNTPYIDLESAFQKAKESKRGDKVEFKFFTCRFYLKGTCHLEFTNLDLLKKFNLFGSQRKGWLPPSYGKANYEDMSQEEKEVIDSFEGALEYSKVMAKKDYYITNSYGLLMLEAS